MKFILDGGWNNNNENSVNNNIFVRYTDFIFENLNNGKKLLIVTNAKSIDHYKDRITQFINHGAYIVGRDTKSVNWGKYDLILTLGGDTGLLLEELLRLNFKIENLKDSVLYIGSSAGAQVISRYLYDYDRKEKSIKFSPGFLSNSNTIYLVHSDNALYVDEYLKMSVQKFAEENNLDVSFIKENEVIEVQSEIEKILFWNDDGDYGCFSNFASYPIIYDGVLWPTTEHTYQAAKFDDEKIKNEILNTKSPLDAFHIGRNPKNILKKNWFEIRVKVMEEIVREKIKQYPDIFKKLEETGDKEMVEASPTDSFWGWGSDKNGENNMGKIWMKLRDEIMNKK